MNKHVLYLTQYYLTDKEGGGQRHFHHVNALVNAGYKVSVITSYVDYISRKIPEEYLGKKVVKENVNENLTIYRTYAYPGYGKDAFSRIRNMTSYSYQAYQVAKNLKNLNLIITSSPPLTLGVTAYFLSMLKRIKFIFEVRDLWPDTPVMMGTLNNKYLINTAKIIESLSYKKASAIIALTQGMRERIINKNISPDKVYFVANGADIGIYKNIDNKKPLSMIRESEDEFIITYAGVHSSYPDLQNFLNAGKLLKENKNIKLVLVGDGDNKPELDKMKEEMNLNNVHLYGRQPKQEIPKILASTDVCLVSYQDLEFWRHAFPNKTFDYMASSRPIIASVLDGEITDLIKKANCGVCINPSKPELLAEAILNLYNDRSNIDKMGLNGRKYVEENYNRSILIKKYLEIIKQFI